MCDFEILWLLNGLFNFRFFRTQGVNGPEVLNKFVGESEAKIRKLFEPAEEEQKKVRIILCKLWPDFNLQLE